MKATAVGWCLFLFVWGLTTHGKNTASGDEPHYLAITRSLAHDFDIDVSNNYDPPDLPGGLQPGPHARPARDGRLLPVHDIGLAVVLLPSYMVASRVAGIVPSSWLQRFKMTRGLFEYALISLTVLGAMCGGVVLLARALAQVTTPRRALVVAAAVGFSPPILTHSFLLFPEELAFITGCAVVWWICQRTPSGRSEWLIVAALGLLPWAHHKFSPFVIACAVAMAGARWSYWRSIPRRRQAGLLCVLPIPHALMFLWTLYTWGNLGGAQSVDGLPFQAEMFGAGFAGQFLDRQSGLLSNAPIYILLIAAWALASPRTRWLLLPAAAIVLPTSAFITWSAGFSPAARYLVPVIPFCALAMAESAEYPAYRRMLIGLVVPQIPIIAYGWQHPRLFWPDDQGNALLLRLGPIGRAYEQFLPPVQFDGARSAILPVVVFLAVNAALIVLVRRYDGIRDRSRDARP